MEKNIDELTNWYIKQQPTYSQLAKKVESIIKDVLDSKNIKYYSISSRAKEIKSFVDKAKKDKYKNPTNEIQDFAGIRIITYVKSEVDECCKEIEPLFAIDDQNSQDKSSELGEDRVGYRSVHYVAEFTEDRLQLPEYQLYKGLKFEIQVRTILEHAWADIAHDRSYKFQGSFPKDNDIKRRFSLVAATLELVDNEFDSIAKTLVEYQNEVAKQTEQGDLNIPINSSTLEHYLTKKMDKYIKNNFVQADFGTAMTEVIEELKSFGIITLEKLDKKINDLLDKNKDAIKDSTFSGVLRYSMIFDNAEKYFAEAWKENWMALGEDEADFFESNGINFKEIAKKYHITISKEYNRTTLN